MDTKGIYIYGIVPNLEGVDHIQLLKESGVYFITYRDFSAVVSDTEKITVDYTDRESLARLLINHQKTIESIMAIGFDRILPMKLGTIVTSKEEVTGIIFKGYELINSVMKNADQLVEIDLAATWGDMAGIISEIANHPDIVALKEEILRTREVPSNIDQVKMGMQVKVKLEEKNKSVELRIMQALSVFCEDIKVHEVMNDQMITNSAYLIHRSKLHKFENAIDLLDEEFKGLLNFKMVGPLPCYSFYTIEVKELNLELIQLAKEDLELHEEHLEHEIKKAYIEKARLYHPDAKSEFGNEANFKRINKAYHLLLEYVRAKEQMKTFGETTKEAIHGNKRLILIKIKE